MFPRPLSRQSIVLALVSLTVLGLSTTFSAQPLRLSGWRGAGLSASFSALPAATAVAEVSEPNAENGIAIARAAEPGGEHALEAYNQDSALQDSAGDGRVRFYRRDLPGGGALAYVVVLLDEQVRVAVANADGATPATDSSGDTIWADRQQHLATVEEIAHAPYAARQGMALVGAMAFGFHGGARTSDEGTVLIDGQLHHLNPGRATLCITGDNRAHIGLFDAAHLQQCAQAFGAGPVILLGGKVADPAVAAPTDTAVPYNPLGEDFTQLDWRRQVYSGTYPKSVIGVGARDNGSAYLVLLVSYGVRGIELAEQLRAMGCADALGGDDDSSTQAVWRGAPVVSRQVAEVPDAVAVYVRE